jgi:hypothetical protein
MTTHERTLSLINKLFDGSISIQEYMLEGAEIYRLERNNELREEGKCIESLKKHTT